MCEASTIMMGVGMAVTALSTGVQMYAQAERQRVAEDSARASAEYNAQAAANEQATQERLARNEISKGIADRERQQRQAARAMGEMRANMGASGFEMDTGSMVSLLDESATEHQYDSSIIRQNSEQAAWQHLVGAASASNNQAFARHQGDNAGSGRTGSYLGMGGTLLGGIGKGVGQYNEWQKGQRG